MHILILKKDLFGTYKVFHENDNCYFITKGSKKIGVLKRKWYVKKIPLIISKHLDKVILK